MKKRPLQSFAETALAAALLCVVAPFTIPGPGAVPISLATFCVLLTALLLGWGKATAAVAVYLALGAAGLPVFAGGAGGVGILAGPTGGYLFGYLFLAFFSGLFRQRSVWLQILMTLFGTAVLYTFGTAWFMIRLDQGFGFAVTVCVLPFLPGDAIKIAAAFLFRRAFSRRKLF